MVMSADPHDLDRFVQAQAPVHETALAEVRSGRKRSHWMWFVFPQMRGLGSSAMSHRYGIASAEEATAYLAHHLLGPRLIACCDALLAHDGLTAHALLGSPDDLKLRSSMTLFAAVSESGSPFHRVLARYFDGRPDDVTLRLLTRA